MSNAVVPAQQTLREGRSNSRLRRLFSRPSSETLNVCFPSRRRSAMGRELTLGHKPRYCKGGLVRIRRYWPAVSPALRRASTASSWPMMAALSLWRVPCSHWIELNVGSRPFAMAATPPPTSPFSLLESRRSTLKLSGGSGAQRDASHVPRLVSRSVDSS